MSRATGWKDGTQLTPSRRAARKGGALMRETRLHRMFTVPTCAIIGASHLQSERWGVCMTRSLMEMEEDRVRSWNSSSSMLEIVICAPFISFIEGIYV